MKILIACEESQAVCKAFREKGHEAYSCDIQDCSGGHPEWHIKGDVTPLLSNKWDMIIAFPPCNGFSVGASADCARDNGKIIAWSDPRTAIIRSKTFPGIAKAMAEQWG